MGVCFGKDVVAGDGTTSVVVLCGALLKKCMELLSMGVHPTAISDAFLKAVTKSCEVSRMSGSINTTAFFQCNLALQWISIPTTILPPPKHPNSSVSRGLHHINVFDTAFSACFLTDLRINCYPCGPDQSRGTDQGSKHVG